MRGDAEKLVRFLEGTDKRFIIPIYQRNYDWGNEQCRQLYEDLIKVVRNNRKSHFFGSIVSVHEENGSMYDYLIIDGQQRLTTVSLLLLAIYNLLANGIVTSQEPLLKDKILENYLIDKYQRAEKRIKLKPIKNDQNAFNALFGEDDVIPDSNVTINYRYFYDRIQKMEVSVDELFDAISKLEIITILLNSDDNPQLIFESLNSTGLDLSEGDKIRNYVLMGQNVQQQENLYKNYWSKIESKATYGEFDVSSFVRDYLSIRRKSTPNLNKVYSVFKQWVEYETKEDIVGILNDLLAYAKRYGSLLRADAGNDRLNSSIYRLNRLETSVARPFLMEVLRLREEGALSDADICSVFEDVESYIFRRAICDLPTNALNKIFVMLCNEIDQIDGENGTFLEKFRYVLANKKDRSRFPDDREFVENIATRNIYHMKNKQYLFVRLENSNTKETKDIWTHLDKGDYSIEHIMPQHPVSSWKIAIGTDFEEVHETWLNRLANLTLTAYNSEMSNASFFDKVNSEHGFLKSGLRMNQWIAQQKQWGVAELEERTEQLKESAVKIWKYPTTTFQPVQKVLTSVSLADEADMTGRKISRYNFRGIAQSVASWTEMFQQVVRVLHQEKKEVLKHLAYSQNQEEDLSAYFATTGGVFASAKEIDNDVYLNVSFDTRTKLNLLRRIFALFSADENELMFFLANDDNDDEKEGSRFELRKRFWTFALPEIQKVSGLFGNKQPSTRYYLEGRFGVSYAHIGVVAKLDSVRADFYFSLPNPEQTKKLFDWLYMQKDEIEKKAGRHFVWERLDAKKACRISLGELSIGIKQESEWVKLTHYLAEGSKIVYLAFGELVKRYLNSQL